jgi:hypothetical protein
MTNFLTIDRDHWLFSYIVGVSIDDQTITLHGARDNQHLYDYPSAELAENEYLKLKQQLEAWHLKQDSMLARF